MAEEEARTVERRVIRELKNAFAELYFIQRKIDLHSENLRLMQQFADIASRQYEVGIGSQTDALRARTESSKLTVEAYALEREKRSAEAMLNTLLNRPLEGTFERIDTLDTALPDWTREKIDSVAVAARPELLAMRFEVEMGKAGGQLSQMGFRAGPDGPADVQGHGHHPKDYWSLMVGVALPMMPWAYPKASRPGG